MPRSTHRGQTDSLEADLWEWRAQCRASGKKIPKRLVQARAKWAFHRQGIAEFKASDGWYWKWLAKWKKKTMGTDTSSSGLRIPPAEKAASCTTKTISEGISNTNSASSAWNECQGKSQQSHSSDPTTSMVCGLPITEQGNGNHRTTVGLLDSMQCDDDGSNTVASFSMEPDYHLQMDEEKETTTTDDSDRQVDLLIGNQEDDVEDEEDLMTALTSHLLTTDILPLVVNGDEVSLASHPTDSTLPVSPIFICNNSSSEDKEDDDDDEEATTNSTTTTTSSTSTTNDLIPPDLATCEATMDMQVSDLDANSLANLLAEVCTKNPSLEIDCEEEGCCGNNNGSCLCAQCCKAIESRQQQQEQEHCETLNFSRLYSLEGEEEDDDENSKLSPTSNSNCTDSEDSGEDVEDNDDISGLEGHMSDQTSQLSPLCLPLSPMPQTYLPWTPLATASSISSTSPPSVCSQWSPSSSKENYDPDKQPASSNEGQELFAEQQQQQQQQQTKTKEDKKKLTVIARHRRLGEESLCRLKEEVRRYAVDHTFKETAKKFGIHHSTVSGWVKARERTNGLGGSRKTDGNGVDVSAVSEKADDIFISWLKSNRESGVSVTLARVKEKVAQLFSTFGVAHIEKSCKWFLLWNNRREEKQYVEGMEDEEVCRRETPNLAYPPAFKLEVALHAQRYSQYAAAKIFSVARRRIFDWMRQIPKLQDLIAKGHMKKMTGRGPKNRDIDQALYEWYSQRRAAGERPRSCEVQSRAREIYCARGYTDMKCSYGWFKRWSQRFHIQLRYSYDDDLLEWILAKFDANAAVNHHDLQTHGLSLVRKEDPHFKASSGWAIRFCRRHSDYLNTDFSTGPRLPDHLEERGNRFRHVLQQLVKDKGFTPDQIGCMDELPLHLTSALKEKRGYNGCNTSNNNGPSPLIKHCGLKGAQAAVILSSTAAGRLLPPLVVLKGDTKPGLLTVPDCETVVVLVNNTKYNSPEEANNAIMPVNERTVGQWLSLVWFRHVDAASLLLADTFHAHTAASTQKAMVARGSCLAIIPSACSPKLQPLHRGIKHKFKELVEQSYLRSPEFLNASPTNTKPSQVSIVKWVDQAYKALKSQQQEIIQSFIDSEVAPPPPAQDLDNQLKHIDEQW